MNAGRTASGLWLVPVLVGFVAAAAGLGAGWYLHTGAPAPAQPPQARGADAVTREELETAKREILAQLEALGRARPTSASAPSAASNDTVIELGRRIDDLDARIAVLATGVRPGIGGRAWSNARGPGSQSIEKIIARVQEQARREHADEPGEDAIPTILREHSLWTVEDVARTYGPPLRADGNDGLAFRYGRFALENYAGEYSVYFRFREGFVTDFGFDSASE